MEGGSGAETKRLRQRGGYRAAGLVGTRKPTCLLSTKACELYLLATSNKIMNLDMSICLLKINGGFQQSPHACCRRSQQLEIERRVQPENTALLASEESHKSR